MPRNRGLYFIKLQFFYTPAFTPEVSIAIDSDSSALTGVRKHEAFLIVKAFDKSLLLLYNEVYNGETFPLLKLDWYRIDEKGDDGLYFTQKFIHNNNN